MSVEAMMDVEVRVPVGSAWDTWHSVKITNKLETLAVLIRVLSERKTLTEYDSIALGSAMFHLDKGWARVDSGGWVHWSRSETRDQIWFAFLNEPQKE